LLEALDLHDVTLAGTGHPGPVLTNCDSYEHFPPKGFNRMAAMSRRLPILAAGFIRFLASGPGRRIFMKAVTVHPPTGDTADRVFEAFATSKATRKDALRVTQSLESSITLEAVDALRAFDKPVLLAWGDSDKLFPLDHAERLRGDFADASTYVMLDKPYELAAAITAFDR
jgi:pimeloyl-ACP methyl ester carboxylesterase